MKKNTRIGFRIAGTVVVLAGVVIATDFRLAESSKPTIMERLTISDGCGHWDTDSEAGQFVCDNASVEKIVQNKRMAKAESLILENSLIGSASFAQMPNLKELVIYNPGDPENISNSLTEMHDLDSLQLSHFDVTKMAITTKDATLERSEVWSATPTRPEAIDPKFSATNLTVDRFYNMTPTQQESLTDLVVNTVVDAKKLDLSGYTNLAVLELTTTPTAQVILPKHVVGSDGLTISRNNKDTSYSFYKE